MHTRLIIIALAVIAAGCQSSEPKQDTSAGIGDVGVGPLSYQCLSGGEIVASYPSDSTAVVEYDDQTFQMTIAISASGARYVGDGFVWWTKGSGAGSDGTLYHDDPEGAAGELMEQCTQTD